MSVSFDRKGRCPICRKDFRSAECPHSWDYVMDVLQEVDRRKRKMSIEKDVSRLMKRKRRKRR